MSDKLNSGTKTTEDRNNERKGVFGKIACVLIAIILWVYVSYDKNPDSDKTFTNIPVSLAGIEALEGRNLTVLTSDMYASVKLSGTRNILSKVDKKDIKAVVNVSDITSIGEQNPILTISGIPDALNVDERRIISGRLITDNLVKKSLDLNIELSGQMDDSIVEGEKSVFPSHVTVKGPGTLLENLNAWTEAIDISNVKKSENIFNTGIVLKDNKGEKVVSNMITVSDTSATVTLNCQGKKEVELLEPEIIGTLEGYNITVEKMSPDKVIIMGAIEDIAFIDNLELQPLDAMFASEKVKCSIIIPENIICDTTKTEVTLKIESLREMEDSGNDITEENDNLSAANTAQ